MTIHTNNKQTKNDNVNDADDAKNLTEKLVNEREIKFQTENTRPDEKQASLLDMLRRIYAEMNMKAVMKKNEL